MKEAIQKVIDKENLSREEAARVMELLLTGQATQAQIGAFLTGLRAKGETIDEIVGLATVLGDKAEHIKPKTDGYIDLVGTGGDRSFSFNISTTASFAVAAAGVSVAKHGNRSISSKSGAGDVLEALGVNIMLEPEHVETCVDEIGIGFMFAQTFNKSMRFVGQARSEMGIRTVFNILGPLANPSDAKGAVIGIYDPALTETIASALSQLGVERAMVVSGADGMDEITLTGPTYISELKDGRVENYTLTPEQFGMKTVNASELRGGNGTENAEITKAILDGQKGSKRDVVLLNAAAGLYIGGKAANLEEGISQAAEALDSGKARKVLENLVEYTNRSFE